MPNRNSSISLKGDLAKLAKLSSISGALPTPIRAAPALAVFAGGLLAQATNSRNVIEDRLLDTDPLIPLEEPSKNLASAALASIEMRARPGIRMLCATCYSGSRTKCADQVARARPNLLPSWYQANILMDTHYGHLWSHKHESHLDKEI